MQAILATCSSSFVPANSTKGSWSLLVDRWYWFDLWWVDKV